MFEELMRYNETFVKNDGGRQFQAEKYPRKKLAVVTCMDTRLVELLPAALGIHNGDVKMIKNAGGLISGPLDDAVRSLLIAILELQVEEILVIAHTDCGVAALEPETVISHLIERGISREAITRFEEQGADLNRWFQGFGTPECSVRDTVTLLRSHPLIPKDVAVYGAVIDIKTGELTPVV